MGMVRQWQELLLIKIIRKLYSSLAVVKLAEAYGCVGIKTPEELDDKIIEMLNTDRPVILIV